MKKTAGLLFCVLTALSLSSCSLGTERVNIVYVAEHPQTRPGGGTVIVVNKAVDKRPWKDLVGGKKNALGITMGQVRVRGDVELAAIISTDIADSLNLYGYDVKFPGEKLTPGEAASAKTLDTTILHFWTVSIPEVGDVLVQAHEELLLELKDYPAGAVVWKKTLCKEETEKVKKGEPIDYGMIMNQNHENLMKEFQETISSPEFIKAAGNNITQTLREIYVDFLISIRLL